MMISSVETITVESTADEPPVTLQPSEERLIGHQSRETRAVYWLKLILLVVLCCSAAGVAVGVYYYTTAAQDREFVQQYTSDAGKIVDTVGASLFLSLGALDAHVVNAVSVARSSNQTWPFVTTPDFAVRASKVRSLSKAYAIATFLRVQEGQREEWEAFSVANDGWVEEGMERQLKDKNYFGSTANEFIPHDKMFTTFEGELTRPYGFVPRWESYPVVPVWAPYNWDVSATRRVAAVFPEVLEMAKVMMSFSNLADPNDPIDVRDANYADLYAKDHIGSTEDYKEPKIEIYYPITLNGADEVDQLDVGGNETTTVGFVAILLFWKSLIENILPVGHDGVLAVFEFGEHQTFTYEIVGPEVIYLGRGDLHDSAYDALKVSIAVPELQPKEYTGLPLSRELSTFTMNLYPSAGMQSQFTTSEPVVFTVMVVIIFVFTSAVFLAYDWFVERRQRRILTTAVQSTEEVSLLEQKVRERTRKLQHSYEKLEEANRKVTEASAAQLQHFACMSHEIRTPLNCIIGLSSLLEETELDEMQKDSMRMIVTSGELLSSVINDVLDYSKLESGNVEIDLRKSNLQQTLSSVVHSIEMRGKDRDISVQTFYDGKIPGLVTTDMRRVQQILYNLLGNAVKFSKPRGTVEFFVLACQSASKSTLVEDSYSPQSEEDVAKCAPTDNILRFIVKDYGKGIKNEEFPRIFKPFLQSGKETEIVYGGTGLGLAITAKLVHRMGGSISVRSVEGEWAEFTVDLPLLEPMVHPTAIPDELKTSMIFFVGEKEDQRQIGAIFEHFRIECRCFEDMKVLNATLYKERILLLDTSCVCLVAEDRFDKELYNSWKGTARTVLITFGPTFMVPESHRHFRCLTSVLPSVLLDSIAACVKQTPRVPPPVRFSMDRLCSTSSLDQGIQYLNYRYLIAEDNLINVKVLCRILDRIGIKDYKVVDNGAKAVELEAQEAFDVVLMDGSMPVMDGIEACRLIKAREGDHPTAEVVFVTAHAQESFEAACREAGAIGFLAKPCNLQNVEDVLKALSLYKYSRTRALPKS